MPVPVSHDVARERRAANEARARELEMLEREIARDHRRLLWETLLGCVCCSALGLFLVSWAVHTTDPVIGGISFWVGLLACDVGMIALLVRYFQRSEEVGSP